MLSVDLSLLPMPAVDLAQYLTRDVLLAPCRFQAADGRILHVDRFTRAVFDKKHRNAVGKVRVDLCAAELGTEKTAKSAMTVSDDTGMWYVTGARCVANMRLNEYAGMTDIRVNVYELAAIPYVVDLVRTLENSFPDRAAAIEAAIAALIPSGQPAAKTHSQNPGRDAEIYRLFHQGDETGDKWTRKKLAKEFHIGYERIKQIVRDDRNGGG
jgi:hypothetical protein